MDGRMSRGVLVARLSFLALVAAVAAALLAGSAPAAASSFGTGEAPIRAVGVATLPFAPTGNEQVFVVPSGVASLTVTAIGAAGGAGGSPAGGGAGGAGGEGEEVSSVLAVTPGSTLYVEVGGAGGNGAAGLGGAGGFNDAGSGGRGGSASAGGGGGDSDVRTVSISLGNFVSSGSRLIVAGGGGGGGSGGQCPGGPGGMGGSAGLAGTNGGSCGVDGADAGGSGGPTPVSLGCCSGAVPGGSGGRGTSHVGHVGAPGFFFGGGSGATAVVSSLAGGGGGGGGGAVTGGGGGGGGLDNAGPIWGGGGGGGAGTSMGTDLGPTTSPAQVVISYTVPGFPDPMIALRHQGTFREHRQGTFMMWVTNTGSGTAFHTTVTFHLTGRAMLQGGHGQGWTCRTVHAVVACSHGAPIFSGDRSLLTVTIMADAKSAGTTLTATAAVSALGSIPSCNTSTEKVTIGRSQTPAARHAGATQLAVDG